MTAQGEEIQRALGRIESKQEEMLRHLTVINGRIGKVEDKHVSLEKKFWTFTGGGGALLFLVMMKQQLITWLKI